MKIQNEKSTEILLLFHCFISNIYISTCWFWVTPWFPNATARTARQTKMKKNSQMWLRWGKSYIRNIFFSRTDQFWVILIQNEIKFFPKPWLFKNILVRTMLWQASKSPFPNDKWPKKLTGAHTMLPAAATIFNGITTINP